jgi:hypothetical protein
MKVEIVITDHVTASGTFSRPKTYHKEVAHIVLPVSNDDAATNMINFAESCFDMSAAPQPASNYHAGLRLMFMGIYSANVFRGEVMITAKVIE